MSTSFVKRQPSSPSGGGGGGGGGGGLPSVRGARPSPHGLHLIASSGVTTLDSFLGGGIPAGSVVLLINESDEEEDGAVDYTRLLFKYFLAEGAACGNGIFHASESSSLISGESSLLDKVPDIVSSSSSSASEKEGVGDGDDHLKIAWRYKNQSHSSTSGAASAGRSFNLNKPMSRERLLECAAEVKEWTEDDDFEGGDRYRDMCIKLAEALKQDRYSANVQAKEKNLLRITIEDIGGLLWTEDGDPGRRRLLRFLLALRSLLRSHLGICLMSVRGMGSEEETVTRIVECCDFALALKSFGKDIKRGGLFKNHHGFLDFRKFSGFNSLVPPTTPPARCVFRSTRTKMVVEQVHLPPDIGEDDQKPATKKQSIDF